MAQNLTPAFILVRPQMPENVGAAARAMLNFGLTDLRIVAPQMLWPNERAITMSSGASRVIENTQVFENVSDALADVQVSFATTGRVRELHKKIYTPSSAIGDVNLKPDAKIAFVFGPERTGLENDDLAGITHLISIPVNPEYPSLNLAQAICVLAYEYGQKFCDAPDTAPKEALSTHEERTFFNARLNTLLEEGDFYQTPEKKPAMQRKVQTLFERLQPTRSEIQILHGILTAIAKKNP